MTRFSNNTKAAIVMVIGIVSFTINDAFMKSVMAHVPLMQAIFLRGLFNIGLVSFVLVRLLGVPRFDLPRRDWVLVVGRAGFEAAAAFSFLYAVTRMRFANAVAIEQMVPLVIALAGFIVFRDPLGWRRSLAVIVGFIGALLIIKPGTGAFNSDAIWPFVTVLCITARDMCVRAMSAQVPTSTIAIVTALCVTSVAGLASIGTDWVPLTVPLAGGLVAAAFFLIGGYVCSILVMQIGDMTATAPYRYMSVLTALVIGYFAFGEWPDRWALLGAAIIAATGIFTVMREAQLARRAARG